MGCLSCNAESAVATCDSYNWELLTKKPVKNHGTRPVKILEFDFSVLHSATNGFSARNLLGKGSHGAVYKAKIHRIKAVAAVKRTKQTQSCGDSTADAELEILSRIYHPRLVNLLGYAIDPNQRKLIVVEYMPNGSLYDLLHRSAKPPGWVKRTRFALQVARAVQFLHASNPPIIHRDIKSSNILIDANFSSRLSDFGLSLRGHVGDVKVKCTPPAGTLGYLDPEYLAPGDLSTKSDVFSFGILMLEIITGRNAIDVNFSPPSVVEWAVPAIKQGDFIGICDLRIRPPGDWEALRRMAVLAARCVRSTAAKRPGMTEVVECLKIVHQKMKARAGICINLGSRVGEDCRAIKYEPLDESFEMARNSRTGSRRNGKVSSVSSSQFRRGDQRGKSKSIGTASEIKFLPPDETEDHIISRSVGLRLNKSRSVGFLRARNDRPAHRRTLKSNLLVDLEE
ncbi:serine/threonine-protein kinase-like protein-like [Dorcoceras hygrometricum]|uniref:Serine/threonine-protein kinase-like protein-like n=1 Tax=Dorcoceras hygrometricum TaxID=472368 RepID=A0A2Z7D4K9_9LAMI|nr:serine/threonine-protein kinase-like protein-like [Dorcoceras hygrometricum]